eukprot:TRINITY_DN4892_c0_g1_i1.p1 TRINITY_DN4892_c0_g1~~TRINITY_DN4892_c0_g1_i1.p1  ORF type:complete len:123 (-),score=18.65 TRINITY_DN4892_c0_g1_i1:74-442(-)
MVVPYEPMMNHSVPSHNMTQQAWRSPVPYLFGGVAAMLALIAVALLILACSYWKLSGEFNGSPSSTEGVYHDGTSSPEQGKKKVGAQSSKSETDKEEKVIVIMAGQDKPTFLAKPAVLDNMV